MAVSFSIESTWVEPEALQRMLHAIERHRPTADLPRIRYAYYTAENLHQGQTRKSGEPYITHPLAVAQILADLRMDDETIIAALLHDVIEDCPTADRSHLEQAFGEEVVALIDGVTKLKMADTPANSAREKAAAESNRAAESLRKMLLAMAKDVRVMVIKLADRLHNMLTLDSLAPERRTRIANETLDIYAPLAARLGIWQIKWQLEDLAFKHLHPKEYEQVREMVAKTRGDRERELTEAIAQLRKRLEERGIQHADIHGRPKHLYSIFNKIVKHGFRFEDIMDLLAMRVIVHEISDCYLALGLVHEMWMPIPGLFYDYVAKPKPNGYQSLHTKVMGPHGEPLEVQIRTQHMHEVAEYGVAAHWSYKEGARTAGGAGEFRRLREQLFDWSSDYRTSSDFLRSLSTDLFSEQVFVFTPKGDVLDLPKDSTPIDFAFRVHSGLGLTTVGAKVNGKMVPLSTGLTNGDVVELITRSNAVPSIDWLEFVKSAHARSKLRGYFRKRNRTDNAARGRDALERELRSLGLEPREFLGEERLKHIAEDIPDCENAADFLAKVGEGLITVQSAVLKLRGIEKEKHQKADVIQTSTSRTGKLRLVASGVDNIASKRAKCCDPIPGEDVVGYVTRGRGIVIHRKMCPNAINFETTEPERLVPLDWPPDGNAYGVNLKIESVNRQGLLMDISTVFGESKTNVVGARIRTLANQTAEIDVTIEVNDAAHLARVITQLSQFSDVISVLRLFGKTAAK